MAKTSGNDNPNLVSFSSTLKQPIAASTSSRVRLPLSLVSICLNACRRTVLPLNFSCPRSRRASKPAIISCDVTPSGLETSTESHMSSTSCIETPIDPSFCFTTGFIKSMWNSSLVSVPDPSLSASENAFRRNATALSSPAIAFFIATMPVVSSSTLTVPEPSASTRVKRTRKSSSTMPYSLKLWTTFCWRKATLNSLKLKNPELSSSASAKISDTSVSNFSR
mmetsp:Transcript_28023/g.65109  ORF Transcript_28023/g.65109 Transcript_28023/m.65109 type:complete len:223 (+) Transcript_28023:82-750(+)